MSQSTETLYDESASRWARTEPILLSDFTARPAVLELCEPVQDLDILDLGCGEGYVARQLLDRGARSLLGVDLSSEMIALAERSEQASPRGAVFRTGNAEQLAHCETDSFDLVLGVFLFNYQDVPATRRSMAEVRRVLRPDGRFVFAVPHPSLPWTRAHEAPFFFDAGGRSYLEGTGATFEGSIWRRDGIEVAVRCVHKTWTDLFGALRAAGFSSLPEVVELGVTEEHLALDPEFFGPLKGQPLHAALRVGP